MAEAANDLASDPYTGGAWLNGQLYTWGAHLRQWNAALTGSRVLTAGPFRFGTTFQGKLVLERRGVLRWGDQVIDVNTQVIDAREATLFGRTGLLVVHRGMQLRFYERPEGLVKRWPYREIYSFYTASEQGGLVLHDVDGDGRIDILCGNYWVQSPPEFDLPWRLFAINLFNEHPQAASARLAWHQGRLLWLESKRPQARAFWFTPPADPKQLWDSAPVGLPRPLNYPRALLIAGGRVLVGEQNGPQSACFALDEPRPVITREPLHTLLDTPAGVVGIGPTAVRRL